MLTHKVKVITNSDPIKFLLQKPILNGQYAKWMLMLSELDISMEKPKAIKSQAPAEFLKYTKHTLDEEVLLVEDREDDWTLYFDSASTHNEGSAGIVLTNKHEEVFKKAIKLTFSCSNNEAEYEVLAIGLDLANDMKISKLRIYGDSNLIIKQLDGEFTVK